jgi:CRP-like cAMP-binding protein
MTHLQTLVTNGSATGGTLPRLRQQDLLKMLRVNDPQGVASLGGRIVTAEPRAQLVSAGLDGSTAGVLLSGWACRSAYLPNGRRQIVDVLLPGDLFGLEAAVLGRSEHVVMALSEASFQSFDAGRLRERLMSKPQLAFGVIGFLLNEQHRQNQHIVSLGRCRAEERMARFMLGLRARLTDRGMVPNNSFRLPLTQQEIGDHLGLTVVHVNRVLRSLREAGALTLRDRTVRIGNLDRLSLLAAPLEDIPEPTVPRFNGGSSNDATIR